MEAQLAEYRAKRKKEQNSTLSRVYNRVLNIVNTESSHKELTGPENTVKGNPSQSRKKCVPVFEVKNTNLHEVIETEEVKDWRDYFQLGLKFILWLCLWKFFVEIGFGAVYFIVSCSYLMYRNTRTGPRQRGQLSAYSVFNPNQERLDGTFTAEQFEKELRMGAGSVK